MMLPEEVFKRRRRHNNTPESALLIIANFIIIMLCTSLFTTKDHINWFFWVVLGGLVLYNFFTIRRHREEFNKITIISYAASVVVLIALFFIFKGKG